MLLAAVFFLIDFQHFRKYFKISLKKVCSYQNTLYICIVKQLKQRKMTTTQKAFNNIQTRIEELTALRPYTFGYAHGDLLNTIKVLENKLAEIAMELTAERHATQY